MGSPTNYYVDPAIAANSGTGTIGDPYGDLQYALNTVTRDATNGDQFNVKAGTDEVLAAALSLATYGTPTITAPLILRGYTSAANDGGVGGISGNGSLGMFASAYNFVHLIDMHFHNSGSAVILNVGNCYIRGCEVNNTTGNGIAIGNNGVVVGCYIHDCGGVGVTSTLAHIYGNFLKNGTKKFSSSLGAISAAGAIAFNVLSLDSASDGIRANSNNAFIFNNSIYSSSGTGAGIDTGGGTQGIAIFNNIIEGFSGTGGIGVVIGSSKGITLYTSNKFYNNSTHESISSDLYNNAGNNDTLGASPFTNPSGDDFSVSTAVKAGAYPSSFRGSSTNQYLDVGAAQREESGAAETILALRGANALLRM